MLADGVFKILASSCCARDPVRSRILLRHRPRFDIHRPMLTDGGRPVNSSSKGSCVCAARCPRPRQYRSNCARNELGGTGLVRVVEGTWRAIVVNREFGVPSASRRVSSASVWGVYEGARESYIPFSHLEAALSWRTPRLSRGFASSFCRASELRRLYRKRAMVYANVKIAARKFCIWVRQWVLQRAGFVPATSSIIELRCRMPCSSAVPSSVRSIDMRRMEVHTHIISPGHFSLLEVVVPEQSDEHIVTGP